MPYQSPVPDFQFIFDHVVGFKQVADTEKFAEASEDMVTAILTEGGKMADEVMAP